METKRILVWTTTPLLARSGGPSTYLYNLRLGLNSSNFPIDYLSDLLPKTTIEKEQEPFSVKVKNGIKRILPKYLYFKIFYKKLVQQAINNYLPVNFYIELDKYAAIHFHSTLDLLKAKNNLKDFNGKIILTTHTPCPPYQHELNHLNLTSTNLEKNDFAKIIKLDFEAFKMADIFVFPCKEAIESYYKGYSPFENLEMELQKKETHYIETGIPQSTFKKNRTEIRKELNIPDNSFVIHYAGRHNYEKGYDLLVEAGKFVLEQNPNVYFLITGKENPSIPKLNHKRWIEIGWTTDPFSYANASDLFVLPNRETYFDLVLVEMISIGIPVLISKIGGNRYFEKKSLDHNIYFFEPDNTKHLLAQLENILNQVPLFSKDKLLYHSQFSLEMFVDNYREFYTKVLENYERRK